MKCFAAPLVLGFAVGIASAQQPANPGYSHVPDQATLSNQKSPKKEKAPTTRTVTGQVTDETGQPLEGALVTLTDSKTRERTEFFTKKDGRYRFEDLSFNNDYEVRARYKDHASEARKLSQYDRTPKPVRILEVNTEAKPGAEGDSAANKESSDPKR